MLTLLSGIMAMEMNAWPNITMQVKTSLCFSLGIAFVFMLVYYNFPGISSDPPQYQWLSSMKLVVVLPDISDGYFYVIGGPCWCQFLGQNQGLSSLTPVIVLPTVLVPLPSLVIISAVLQWWAFLTSVEVLLGINSAPPWHELYTSSTSTMVFLYVENDPSWHRPYSHNACMFKP